MIKMRLKRRLDTPVETSIDSTLRSRADSEIAFTVSNPLQDPEIYGGFQGRLGSGVDSRPGTGALERIRMMACPIGTRLQIQRAQLWREDDELVGKLVGVQVDFASLGMSIRCQQPEGSSLATILSTGNSEGEESRDLDDKSLLDLTDQQKAELLALIQFQQILNTIQSKWDFDGLIEDLLRDWFTTDSMILYWKVRHKSADGENKLDTDTSVPVYGTRGELLPNIVNICAINPAEVDWDDSLGVDRMKVLIGAKLKKRIQTAMSKNVPEQRKLAIETLRKEGIEQKWIDAVKAGKNFVQLSNDDGEYWVVKTKGRRQNGLASPSMKAIFLPLESRKALREGDFAASFMMKHFILHITAGESIKQGPMAGQKVNWAKQKETDALLTSVTNTSRASRIATNHTVKFHFVFPPKEMFDGAKFSKVESQIFTWADVTAVLMFGGGDSGDNQKTGTGFIGIKKLVAKLQKARNGINWIMQEFFDHETVSKNLSAPEGCSVALTFDENALKEPRQLLAEIKFLVDSGIEDVRTAARELGRNADALYGGKMHTKAENARFCVWEPIVSKPGAKQESDPDDDNRGRPPKDETTLTEETRTKTGQQQ